jgi:hypothetical protein
LDQFYAYSNENDPEYDRHENSDQQHSCHIVSSNFEKIKDENKYKNIVDTQAPLHQVRADVFECHNVAIAEPEEYKKRKCQSNPEERLKNCLFYCDVRMLFAEQTQIKN